MMMTQLVKVYTLLLIRKNLPSKIPTLDKLNHPCSPCLHLYRSAALRGQDGGSHDQTGSTKNFASLKWVLNTAQQLVSLTNSLFLSVHYCISFFLIADLFLMNVQ